MLVAMFNISIAAVTFSFIKDEAFYSQYLYIWNPQKNSYSLQVS